MGFGGPRVSSSMASERYGANEGPSPSMQLSVMWEAVYFTRRAGGILDFTSAPEGGRDSDRSGKPSGGASVVEVAAERDRGKPYGEIGILLVWRRIEDDVKWVARYWRCGREMSR